MKVLIFLGPGGVGKTTISAAAAIEISKKYKTILITIDPAQRLKSALSIKIDEIRQINKNLWVTQVNKKDEFLRFIEKYGISDLKNSRLFDVAAGMLPSEEYSAFLKIQELYENDFDFMVVDTPPSSKFISFLDAPRKILNLFETDAIKYFLDIAAFGGKKLSGPLSLAGKILGLDFIVEFAKFLGNLRSVFDKMQQISYEAEKILQGEETYFVGVSIPYDNKIDELISIMKETKQRGLEIKFVIINRFLNFTENGVPINSPKSLEEFHKKLFLLSQKQRQEIKSKLELKNYKVFLIEDFFEDIVSYEVLEEFARKANLSDFLSSIFHFAP